MTTATNCSMLDEHCPSSPDGTHCVHWWDADACHYCGARALTDAELINLGMDPRNEATEMTDTIWIPPHGYVRLLRVAGPWHDDDISDVAHAARVSFDAMEYYQRDRALKLVEYLWAHRHTTPFEMIETWWEVKLPIFVARQLVRHRTVSINEVSRRYVTDEVEFYLPDVWRYAAADKKQGSADDGLSHTQASHLLMEETGGWAFDEVIDLCRDVYEKAIAAGICPEQARMILPLCTYTRWLWHQDLHNLLHMLSLRTDAHAQKETRDVTLAMLALLSAKLPQVENFVNAPKAAK